MPNKSSGAVTTRHTWFTAIFIGIPGTTCLFTCWSTVGVYTATSARRVQRKQIHIFILFSFSKSFHQKHPPQVFYKKAVLKYFSIFTGKHLSLFNKDNIASLQACNSLKSPLSGLIKLLTFEGSLKMMKNAFYFMLKALFVLKIFTIHILPNISGRKGYNAVNRI